MPGAWLGDPVIVELSIVDLYDWLDRMDTEEYRQVVWAVQELHILMAYDYLHLGSFRVVE